MSLAIIVQQEANTANGGSAQGYLTGTDSSTAASTFYGRRLTDLLVNESSTVASFTASTGGSGTSSTAGQFTLVPGTYRIEIDSVYNPSSNTGNIVWGLYNVTSSAFEVYSGTSTPILGTALGTTTLLSQNYNSSLIATITVTTTNKTYEIRHEASSTGLGRVITMCGSPTSMTASNVNSAAAKNLYCVIRILKSA